MVLVGQFGHQVSEHMACRRETVQQKDGRILRIPGFAVKDFTVIDSCKLIFHFQVLPRLVKSPYKTCLLNIPLFMRVRKRLDAGKIVKLGDYLDAKALSIKDCSFREIPFFVAILRQFAQTIFCISVMVVFAFAAGNP